MSPRELLAAARRLVDEPEPSTRGLWARAAALLARQALESQTQITLAKQAADLRKANWRAQLLCLQGVTDEHIARRAYQTWAALSAATHHHGYELPPSAASLRGWMHTVEELLDILDPSEHT